MSKKEHRSYSAELKASAVKLVLEELKSITQVAEDLSIPVQTLHSWVNKGRQGALSGISTYNPDVVALQTELRQLKKQLALTEMERDILKKGGRVLCERQPAKYAFMSYYHESYPLSVMARLLGVSVTGYYDWLHRQPSKRQQQHEAALTLITAAHEATRESYGSVRLHQHLLNQGHALSLHCVRSLRERHDIRCKRHKRFKVTTHSNHQKPVYDNHLKQQFEQVKQANQAWVSDITYVLTEEGWLYVAGVKDVYTKELVGYCQSSRMTTDIVVQALQMAIKRRKPSKGLIVHSDRGSQYCSLAYRQLIEKHECVGSMSAKGNCYDNAPIESFWATLKNELVYHQHYQTRAEAMSDIQSFIEIFYNRMRIQAKLGFRSPAQVFEGCKMVA